MGYVLYMLGQLWVRLKPYYRWRWADTVLLVIIVSGSLLLLPPWVLWWMLPLMLVWTFVFVPPLFALVYGVLDMWRTARLKGDDDV